MSVEAPNHIKFSAITDSKHTFSKHDSQLFQRQFRSEVSHYSTRTDFQPKSPTKDIQWLEYSHGHQQDSDHALSKLKQDHQPTLLKLSNPKHHTLTTLFSALPNHKNVQHLIIRNANFHHQHAQQVARLLQLNDGIAWLVLDHNKIDDRGIRHIANGLEENISVKHAIFSDNDFGNDGAKALANALKKNDSLESLFIQGNEIYDAGMEAIIQALPDAKQLTVIDVRDTPISQRTAQKLQSVCNQYAIRCHV